MKIWIINNYAAEPKYGGIQRHANFAKFLTQMGHDVVVFAGSHIHNSDIQLIEGKEKFQIVDDYPYRWVNVKTLTYGKSMKKRVVSMFQFYFNTWKAAKTLEKPDVIIGSSAHPLAPVAAIRMGKKFGCKAIAEVRDLWPESIVAYGVAKRNNPAVRFLYKLEKWIYTKADRVIFTMEGGRDYIIGQGWDTEHGGSVDISKVYHINNGVDLEAFCYNKEHYALADDDLDDPDTFKVVYTGSIRKVNGVGKLLEYAKRLQDDPKVRLIVFGSGDELDALKDQAAKENLSNIVFKGRVDKEYIPSVLSRCDLCLLHWNPSPITKYGMSMNKLFDYLASGKPVLATVKTPYSVLAKYDCGIETESAEAAPVAEAILKFCEMPQSAYDRYCENAAAAARTYDFRKLTEELERVIKS